MKHDSAESRLAETLFIVEATDFEQHCLWEKHHQHINWKQINSGWIVIVGRLEERPCCIATSWAKIEDQLIMFYDQCSQVTDCEQTDKWLEEHFKGTWDNGRRYAKTNAKNFHLCLSAIREKNAKPTSNYSV